MKATTILLAALSTLLVGASVGQTVKVDEPSICFECHDEISEQLQEKHVHAAFEQGACSDCHNPHASKHAALLARDEKTLCLSCHEDVTAELGLAVAHQPAADGDCGSCHDPHASAHAGQLLAKATDLCQQCHLEVSEWLGRIKVHAPIKARGCARCHATHGSDHEALTKKAVPALCFGCHRQSEKFSTAHKGYRIADSNCNACHDPHSSDRRGLLRANQHSPFAAGKCTSCHARSGDGNPFALIGSPKDVCLKCHQKVGAYKDAEYRHNLDDEASCSNCHNPHASNANALLQTDQEYLCSRCHFNEPGSGDKTQFVTHGGMDCTTCHLPHGADNANYLISTDLDLCVDCHQRAHQVSHPIGPDVIDPRTEDPVTCLSCHQMHGAPFEQYLPLDPAMDLCIQCHRR